MIISKTPLRVSLLGGGTDYPAWSRRHGGLVVGGAINKFSYLTARHLPPFHDFRYRLVYRQTEEVDEVGQLKHGAARAVLQRLGLDHDGRRTGLEITHLSDLPGRSGTGSSSTFVVGMLNACAALKGRLMLPHELAEAAIDIEQRVLGETVGCQDQTFAAHGGLNAISFRPNGETYVVPLPLDAGHVEELEQHLMLFFTRKARTSSEIAATYVPTIAEKEREQFAMLRLANDGRDAICRRQWERLGSLVDQSWKIKSGLSDAVAGTDINRMYLAARIAGAFGGKLTGAGGGGCMILVVPPEKRARVTTALAKEGCLHIPFRFDFQGSSIIFSDKDNLREYRAVA